MSAFARVLAAVAVMQLQRQLLNDMQVTGCTSHMVSHSLK